ncbi:hypothetical protein CPLU01_00567 [Colletotrichum plurivorum]|uniref:Uncharacterized protein n=1 Tax=Colletotrichum plurivorum TaxID=2175906 RepID=A0A8H6U5W6_9PEZI|nr:hypothetical protein CPLU01_00567 [Colletotrichum plurivorum]
MQPGSSVVFNAGTLRRCTRPLESSTTTRLVVRAQPAEKPTVRASPRQAIRPLHTSRSHQLWAVSTLETVPKGGSPSVSQIDTLSQGDNTPCRSPRTNANVQDSSTSDDFLLPGSSSQARSSHCPGATGRTSNLIRSLSRSISEPGTYSVRWPMVPAAQLRHLWLHTRPTRSTRVLSPLPTLTAS